MSEVVEMFLGPLFMNLGTLEGGLKPYGFSGLPVGGARLRERTQESKHTIAIGCQMTNSKQSNAR